LKTRASRRLDARTAAKVMEKSGAADMDTVAELAAAKRDLDLTRTWLRTYKDREQRLSMVFQFVSNALVRGEVAKAQTAMRAAQANDLKDAREAVAQRGEAICLAVEAMLKCGHIEALDKIRRLAPEAFGGEVAMVQAPVATA
jgi:hypothetical protein